MPKSYLSWQPSSLFIFYVNKTSILSWRKEIASTSKQIWNFQDPTHSYETIKIQVGIIQEKIGYDN